jgi:hypothetical protein
MARRNGTILVSLAVLAACTAVAVVMGALWYALWWDLAWIPTPPLCRLVLPSRIVCYHLIHYEMVCWSFLLVAGGLLWGFRRVKRAQNNSDAANPAIAFRLHVERHWRGVADPKRSANV